MSKTIIVTGGAGFIGSNFVFHMLGIFIVQIQILLQITKIIKAKLKVGKGNADELEKIAANTNARRKKNLEGKAHNLGCTVNRCFCNGNMPIHYMLASRIYKLYVNLIEKDSFIRKKRYKDFICRITGYSHISNYISDKSIITFMWIDEGADKAFPDYIKFMREVFKTDKIEIEIIKNQ